MSSTAITADSQEQPTDKALLNAFRKRGISEETVASCGVYTATARFSGGEKKAMGFPFFLDGELSHTKFRHGREFIQHPRPERSIAFHEAGIDEALAKKNFLIITEGEIDCMSLIECGFPNSISHPNGAPQKRSDDPIDPDHDPAFSYIWRRWDDIRKIRRVILATDSDTPGQNLAHELQRRLGVERCLTVCYPGGCKDLNDVLVKHGPDKVKNIIESAQPYPVAGLYTLSDYTEPRQREKYSFGMGGSLDSLIRPSRGQFAVITGVPGHGKSTWLDDCLFNLARDYDMRIAVGTFEAEVKPFYRDQMARRFTGMEEPDGEPLKEAEQFIEDHFVFIGQNTTDDANLDLSITDFINLARAAVIRHGVSVVVIDPWNELEHKRRRGENETEYTARAIREIKKFARLYDVLVIVVAHPAKPFKSAYEEPPGPYDISGSSHWYNKSDIAITVWRSDLTLSETEILVKKVKFRQNGRIGSVVLRADPVTGVFRGPD